MTTTLILLGLSLLFVMIPHGADELTSLLRGRDSLAYHVAGRMFFEGVSPYDAAALRQWQVLHGYPETAAKLYFHYPPTALPFLVPMSLLSYERALLVWFFLNVGLITWAGLWFAQTYSRITLPTVAVVTLSCIFLPHLDLFFEGQVAALFAVSIAGVTSSLKDGKLFKAGCWMVPLLLKPHLFTVLFGVLALRGIRSRWVVAGVGLLLPILFGAAVAEWWVPGIHRAWLDSFNLLPPYPATAALLSVFGSWQLSVSVAATMGILLSILVERRMPRGGEYRCIPLLLALSMLVSPRIWVSDLSVLMLVPLAAAVVLCERRSERGRLLIVAAFAGGQLALILLAVIGGLRDAQDFLWFPLLMLPLALVPIRQGGTSHGRQRSQHAQAHRADQ